LINSYKGAKLLQGLFISFFELIFQPLSDELSTKSAERKNMLIGYKTISKKKF
jgi:hypothetical protein